MLRIILATTSVLVLLIGFALSGWYLLHPESWNWRFADQLLARVTEPSEEAVPVAPAISRPMPPGSRVAAGPQASDEERGFSEDVRSATCVLPSTVSVTRRQNSVIYSWRDERGVLNYSSELPRLPTIQVTTTNYWTDPKYFDLNVEYRGSSAIPDFRNELAGDATGIYKVLARLVGEGNLRKVDLNIVIYPDRAAYLQYANSTTGKNMGNSSGFYSSATNEAVTYVRSQREAVMQTARHETTHVIVTGILGFVPLWLHEGLAEYFTSLDVVGQSKRITLDEQALQVARVSLANGYPRRLRDFLSLSPEAWRGANEQRHYALAGGLLFFLMGNAERRGVLSSLLRTTAAQYCRQLDTTALLDEFYPGGISSLERDFMRWLEDPRPKAPHDF